MEKKAMNLVEECYDVLALLEEQGMEDSEVYSKVKRIKTTVEGVKSQIVGP